MRTPHRVLIQIDLQIEYAMQKRITKLFKICIAIGRKKD